MIPSRGCPPVSRTLRGRWSLELFGKTARGCACPALCPAGPRVRSHGPGVTARPCSGLYTAEDVQEAGAVASLTGAASFLRRLPRLGTHPSVRPCVRAALGRASPSRTPRPASVCWGEADAGVTVCTPESMQIGFSFSGKKSPFPVFSFFFSFLFFFFFFFFKFFNIFLFLQTLGLARSEPSGRDSAS